MAKKAKVKLMKDVDKKLMKKSRVSIPSANKKKAKSMVQFKKAKGRDSKLFDESALSGSASLGKVNLSDSTPMGEALDVRQEAVKKVSEGVSIFDESIGNFDPKTGQGGFGMARKGESGVAAVERIKMEEKKKKKSKVKKRK